MRGHVLYHQFVRVKLELKELSPGVEFAKQTGCNKARDQIQSQLEQCFRAGIFDADCVCGRAPDSQAGILMAVVATNATDVPSAIQRVPFDQIRRWPVKNGPQDKIGMPIMI